MLQLLDGPSDVARLMLLPALQAHKSTAQCQLTCTVQMVSSISR